MASCKGEQYKNKDKNLYCICILMINNEGRIKLAKYYRLIKQSTMIKEFLY